MAYTDRAKQREYSREWVARRRAEYLSDKSCVLCGSTERLELDHIDSSKKVSHRIWSWSFPRRAAELEKCQVLCSKHHAEKSAEQARIRATGRRSVRRKLTDDQVTEIRVKLAKGEVERDIAAQFGIHRRVLYEIKTGVSYACVPGRPATQP